SLSEFEEHLKYAKEAVEANEKLNKELTEAKQRLGDLEKRASEQSALIDSLLPKGASAGLAAAFASRGKGLNTTKTTWMIVFIATVAALGGLAFILATQAPKVDEPFVLHLLQRLPLAAPLIWLGWFSAVQYGNTVRVQE